MGCMVDMQVDAARRFQNAMHLQQAHAEEAEERAHVVSVALTRRIDNRHDLRPVVGYLVNPFAFHVVRPTPTVLKLGSSRKAVRRGVKVLALVERRIGRNEVYRLRIDAAQNGQVIRVVKGTVGNVEVGHLRTRYQVGIAQLLAAHAAYQCANLLARVLLADVVPAREFGHIAV